MEKKKSNAADLEKSRPVFFQIGLLTSLALSFIAFEWTSTLKVSGFDGAGEELVVWEYQYTPDIKIEKEKPLEEDKKEKIVTSSLPPKTVPDDKIIPDPDPDPDPDPVKPKVLVMVTQPKDSLPEGPVETWRLEKYPEFPGGEEARVRWMEKNIRYPKLERENNISEKIFVQFVVTETGKIVDVKAVGRNKGLVREAERVISMMPDWEPGQMGTRKVSAKFSLPLDFRTVGR